MRLKVRNVYGVSRLPYVRCGTTFAAHELSSLVGVIMLQYVNAFYDLSMPDGARGLHSVAYGQNWVKEVQGTRRTC